MLIAEAMRLGMRRLASGVCVIATEFDGERYAMTASSVTSLTDNPASLLFCVNGSASIQSVLSKGQSFSVGVLGLHQRDISNACAQGDNTSRFQGGHWATHPKTNMPYLPDALTTFSCEVDNENLHYGTHQIVIGKIIDVSLSGSGEPLVYVDGDYHALQVL